MNRLFLASVSLPLFACYGGERATSGQCPQGEMCSDQTPHGLSFVGNHLINDLLLSGPRATAVGGTQIVALEYDRGDGVMVALDLPYTTDDDNKLGIQVESTSGSQVTIRGVGNGSNYLRVLDLEGLLMDRKVLTGASLDRMELVSGDFETIAVGTPIAFAPGTRELGMALYGNVPYGSGMISDRIVDTSMSLSLSGADRVAWDTLRMNLTVGTYTLDVRAGDKPATSLDVVVVDHADSVGLIGSQPSTIMTNQAQDICFEALASGRQIVGLTWVYNVDGALTTQDDQSPNRNCITVTTTKTSGSVSVQASAGGQSASIALTVGAAREQLDSVPHVQHVPVALPVEGDRAQM